MVGVESPRSLQVLRRLYAPLLDDGVELIVTDIPTAELAKHASNAFLSLKIRYVRYTGIGPMTVQAGPEGVSCASGPIDNLGSHHAAHAAPHDAG